jgi:hypothetical protein
MAKKNKENDLIQQKYVAEKEYEHAITLMQYATELLWQQFGQFMVAETVLIAFLGSALTENNKFVLGENLFVFVGAIFGLIVCVLWYSTYEYNHTFYRLRIEQAKRHEELLGLRLLTEGKKLLNNESLEINKADFPYKKIVRWFRPHKSFTFLIILFGILFTSLIFFTRPCQ